CAGLAEILQPRIPVQRVFAAWCRSPPASTQRSRATRVKSTTFKAIRLRTNSGPAPRARTACGAKRTWPTPATFVRFAPEAVASAMAPEPPHDGSFAGQPTEVDRLVFEG